MTSTSRGERRSCRPIGIDRQLAKANVGTAERRCAEKIFAELSELVSGQPDQPDLRALKADMAVTLSAHFGDSGALPKAEALYDDLKRLCEEFPDEPRLRVYTAEIAFNLSIDYMKSNNFEHLKAF